MFRSVWNITSAKTTFRKFQFQYNYGDSGKDPKEPHIHEVSSLSEHWMQSEAIFPS